MRLVMYAADAAAGRLGALVGADGLVDLTAASGFATLQALIEAGPDAWQRVRALIDGAPAVLDRAEVRLLPPLDPPVQMRDAMAFELHLKQAMETMIKRQAAEAEDPAAAEAAIRASGQVQIPPVWYQQPVYYKCNRFAVAGPDEAIRWPAYSQLMDYELELAMVIGRRGRDIAAADALDHVFGFTIFNDLSARDAQGVEMAGMLGPAKGKDFDKANVLGPCVVTMDEIGDPQDLTMIVRVNGEERGRGSSASMHWSFAQLIEHISRGETLYPGEVIGSGTVGNGCGLEIGRFLAPGDVIELEIDRIGVLRNRILGAEGEGA